MPAEYFVVRSGEDGTTVSKPMSKAELEGKLAEGYWGECTSFLDRVPDSDKGCWWCTPDGAILVIKGEIVIPRPIEGVQTYESP